MEKGWERSRTTTTGGAAGSQEIVSRVVIEEAAEESSIPIAESGQNSCFKYNHPKILKFTKMSKFPWYHLSGEALKKTKGIVPGGVYRVADVVGKNFGTRMGA